MKTFILMLTLTVVAVAQTSNPPWKRTGTTLSPTNAGDTVTVGTTLPAGAPASAALRIDGDTQDFQCFGCYILSSGKGVYRSGTGGPLQGIVKFTGGGIENSTGVANVNFYPIYVDPIEFDNLNIQGLVVLENGGTNPDIYQAYPGLLNQATLTGNVFPNGVSFLPGLLPLNLWANTITNGVFTADSDWTKGTGWTISAGAANSNGTPGNNALYQNASITATTTYAVSYTILTSTAGYLQMALGGVVAASGTGPQRLAAGAYTDYLTSDGSANGNFVIQSHGWAGSVTNVSVRRLSTSAVSGYTCRAASGVPYTSTTVCNP